MLVERWMVLIQIWGEANVDEAVPEQDAFDLHFSTTGGLASLKMLFLIK